MTFKEKMFSFEGRMGRQDFWVGTLILWGINWAVTIAMIVVMFGPIFALSMAADKAGGEVDDAAAVAAVMSALPALGIYLLFRLAMLWPSCALNVKRLHDRDQPGALVLIFAFSWLAAVIPFGGIAVFIFWVIDLGCLEGTRGPNRFGPSTDPAFGTDQVFA